jgi:hypothetical protein
MGQGSRKQERSECRERRVEIINDPSSESKNVYSSLCAAALQFNLRRPSKIKGKPCFGSHVMSVSRPITTAA